MFRIYLKAPFGFVIFALALVHAQAEPDASSVSQATPAAELKVKEGFKVELLYSVPKPEQGSWVSLCYDNRGRLIVSDQYGKLYRMNPPKSGEILASGDIEKIDLDIGEAQGLLFAFDSLYVVVNGKVNQGRGLYRLKDTNGDDHFDEVKLLRKFADRGGEHGPHAVLLGPDGASLYVVVGDQTAVTAVNQSRVPQVWGEDQLLPRPYGKGFMKGVLAPGGWIAKTDPDGKEWELIATGFRNQYDAAFDRNGELFTYDADMEWDMNTPWYRPTRINHVTSGAEFGWRNGGGKWPAYYPDSLPAVLDIGPGSPTGVAFGFGAKFPKKYQDALYACDWSYGKLYAVHLRAKGASFTAEFEEFITGRPLPLTDILIHPMDGAMYFTTGGRRVQSGLYRVTYVGKEKEGENVRVAASKLAAVRKSLEAFHGKTDAKALARAWPFLGDPDRFLRFAARIAVESQPVATWQDRALSGKDPVAVIQAAIALARHGDKSLQGELLQRLKQIDWQMLGERSRVDLVRAYSLIFIRMGAPADEIRLAMIEHLQDFLPAQSPELNTELLQLLVYLQAPSAATKGVALLKFAPSQEEQMAYAKSLRHLTVGWNKSLREDFFKWFTLAAAYQGGASFRLFVENMKKDALSHLSDEEKVALKEIIEAKPDNKTPRFTFEARSFVKAWKVSDFDDVINVGLEGGRSFSNGRQMFGAGTCFACHRFKQEGGAIGPDLTSAGGKFSPRDLLESIIEPSKEISDQYGATIFTKKDGSEIVGRIMNLNKNNIQVNVNMLNPSDTVSIDRSQLKGQKQSPTSMMPPGLIYTLSKDDVLDLLAYLLSQGNPDDPMFK
ncbi:MAG: c-type cytochrome [Verrucomicrobiales bacterium]|nr:c-type cytochrome [Verrucomicrobiales bacterium]